MITCTNTKSALTAAQTRHWLDGLVRPLAAELAHAGFFACLPDPLIPSAADLLRGTGVRVGAQDCWYDAGDATGETPAALLREVGCTHVMLGHADRRERGETDELIARKTTAAVAAGLVPLVCLGESERVTAREAAETVRAQFVAATAGLSPGSEFAVMYEPGWSIGGSAAAAGHVAVVCEELRACAECRGFDSLPILYGGGVVVGTYTDLVEGGAPLAGIGLGRVVRDRHALAEVLDELRTVLSSDGERSDAGPRG